MTAASFLVRAFAMAPADQVAGRRGPRAWLALVATLAAFAALAARGGANSNGATLDWELDGPEWVDPVLVAAAVGLGLVAMLLWAARRPLVVTLALAVLPCLFGAAALALVVKHRSGRVSESELRAVGHLTTKSGIRDHLGAPAGHGTRTTAAGPTGCLVYIGDAPHRDDVSNQRYFCFKGERLVWRGSW
jgi:hypothetical protein